MRIELTHKGSYALANVNLEASEQVKAEAGAMAAMSADVQIETKSGGVLKGLKRATMGGESFFQNTFTAGPEGGWVQLAPALPGDVIHERLEGQGLIVQDASYLASASTIEVDTRFQGLRSFFGGEGFVMLHVSGTGDLLLSSYGGITRRDLDAGDRMVVDTGHIVAFSEGMAYQTRRVGGLKSALFSGEGIVSEFTGPGTIWIQSRSTAGFLDWLAKHLPGGGGQSGGRRGGIMDMLGGS